MTTLTNLEQARRQALQLLQSNSADEAKKQLLVLANHNYAPALTDLAMILLMTESDKHSEKSAIEYLLRAEALNYSQAIYQLAVMSISDATVKFNWHELNQRMQQCCALEDGNALCDAALLLAHYGSEDQKHFSTPLLELSAIKGSTVALALLGERLASGFLCTKDPARANSIRQLALSAGFPVPPPADEFGFTHPESSVLPNVDLAALNIDTQLTDIAIPSTVIDASINLKQFPNFLTAEECLYIQCLGGTYVKPSITVDDLGQTHQNKIRSSFEYMFQHETQSIYLKLLQRRMAKAAGLPLKNAEQLILLRYTPGQEYKPHRDYLPPSHFQSMDDGGPGQRIRTVVAYLNTPEYGGETAFPLLRKQIKAEQGHIISFDNINPMGELNEASLHAGLPVQQGVKWICTLWIRQSTYR